MRKIEQALVFVLWALLTVSPSGCGDDERTDDDTDDTDDADGGADAGPDSGSDWGSSGVFGHAWSFYGGDGVYVAFSEIDVYGASTTSDEDGYYELELPAGVYDGHASLYDSPWVDCEGWVEPVVVSTGLWVEIDIDLQCADID